MSANFAHVKQGVAVHRTVKNKKSGEETEGTRIYLTSLSEEEGNLERMGNLSRGHWGVENTIHWVRDAVYREDASRIRSGQIASALGLLGTALLAPIRAAGYESPTIAKETFAHNYHHAIRILTHQRLINL
jgi:hypothetical protein